MVAAVLIQIYIEVRTKGKKINALSNVRSITMACRTFEVEWGHFPDFDPRTVKPDKQPEIFGTSTDAFNLLIPSYIDVESFFWVKTKDPERRVPPREDGLLESHENVYCYVAGQSSTPEFQDSPLVADGLMESPGRYGEFHPWLSYGHAIVGFVDGHVREMPLTSKQPGATARSEDGGVTNIFEPRRIGADGQPAGGWLATEVGNLLFPD